MLWDGQFDKQASCLLLDSYGIKVKFFADDAKLYVKIVNSVDTAVLQAALNALCLWADKWQL